jgi:hypothetical protein
MAWFAGWCEVCHGAHSGEGPVLAILAMLALKARCAWLRVAALLSSPPLRAMAANVPGRDGKAGASTEPESQAGRIIASAPGNREGTSWRCGNRGHFGVALTGQERERSHVVRQAIEHRLSQQEGAELPSGLGSASVSSNVWFGHGNRTVPRVWCPVSGVVHPTTGWRTSNGA